MDDQDNKDVVALPYFSLGQKAAMFGTTAFLACGADAIIHAPPPIALGGIVGAYFLARKSPQLYQEMRKVFPILPERNVPNHVALAKAEWTVWDRFLGKHLQPGMVPPQPKEADRDEESPAFCDVPTERMEDLQPRPVNDSDVWHPIFPAYPADEVLELGQVLATGQRFDPHFNGLAGKGLIAAAVQGSGKSQLLGRIIEQTGKCGAPMVVCDHKGEYAPVADLPFGNWLRVGSAELKGHTGATPFFELTASNADAFVAFVMQGRYQAIIDLPSYGDSWLERATIVAEVGQALMRYAVHQRRTGGVLLPCLVALDEAQLYIPQNVNLLPPEAKKNTEILDALNNAYFALVSNGRSNGYTVVFATQSLTYIAKWAIKSCQIRILGRHVEKNDLDMCGEIINPKVATRAEIEQFAPGVGVVFGFTPQPMVVKFDKRLSRDDSETPGLERLRASRQQEESDPQLDQLLAAILSRPDIDADDSRYESDESVYKDAPVGNRQAPVYMPTVASVNGATSTMEPLQPNPRLRLLGNTETPEVERENAEVPAETGNVNATTRDVIKRMVDAGFKHREIAAIVRLNGRKYDIYKQVCKEMGIKIEKD